MSETFFASSAQVIIQYDKICDCRKPKAGMIFEACDMINLHNSILIGDGIVTLLLEIQRV